MIKQLRVSDPTPDFTTGTIPNPFGPYSLDPYNPIQGSTYLGSLLQRYTGALADYTNAAMQAIADVEKERYLLSLPLDLARGAWQVDSHIFGTGSKDVELVVGVERGVIRPAVDIRDFINTSDLVYTGDDNGLLTLRNLDRVEVMITDSPPGVYTLPTNFIADTKIEIYANSSWLILHPGDPELLQKGKINLVGEGIIGPIRVRYASVARSSVVGTECISINSQSPLRPTRYDLWNSFDAFASLLGLTRELSEDNIHLSDRVRSVIPAPGGAVGPNLRVGIGRDLGFCQVLPWNGEAPLLLPPSSTEAAILNLPQTFFDTETLRPSQDGQSYYSRHKDWLPGYEIEVDGVPVGLLNYPHMKVLGYTINFNTPVSGIVTATYQYPIWSRVTVNNYITQIIPSANLGIGDYRVLVTQSIQANSVSEAQFARTALYLPDGSASVLLKQLSSDIRSRVRTTIGSANWGRIDWLDELDTTVPNLSSMPALLDSGIITKVNSISTSIPIPNSLLSLDFLPYGNESYILFV